MALFSPTIARGNVSPTASRTQRTTTSGVPRSPLHTTPRAPEAPALNLSTQGVPPSPSPAPSGTVQSLGQQAQALRFSPQSFTARSDPRIADLIDKMTATSEGGAISTTEDPRFTSLIAQLTGDLGTRQQSIDEVLGQLSQAAQGEEGLRQRIQSLQAGEGVGPIDVQSDAEAAAFRVAREREARRSRSELAERATRTGDINTGNFDTDVSQLRNQAGFDVASNEARIANQRRQEVLAQMLAGANLGLSDIAQQRQTQAGRLASLQDQLGGTQTSLFNAFASANADKNAQIRAAEAARNFELQGRGGALEALLRQEDQRRNAFESTQAQRQFGFNADRQGILDRLGVEQGLLSREDALGQQGFANDIQRLGLTDDLATSAAQRGQTRASTQQTLSSLPRNTLGRVRTTGRNRAGGLFI